MGYVYDLFLGTFTKLLRKATAGHVVSVRLSARNSRTSMERIFVEFYVV